MKSHQDYNDRYASREKWKAIPGFEGIYEISDCGRVRTVARVAEFSYARRGASSKKINVNTPRTIKSKLVKTRKQNSGYLLACLYKDGKRKVYLVHRLVAISFVPNPYNKPQVNHIDGDKENNCSDNLEWVSNGDNQRHKLYVLNRCNGPHPPLSVICLETGVKYPSIAEASRKTGTCRCGIAKVVRGMGHHAGGLHWSLVT